MTRRALLLAAVLVFCFLAGAAVGWLYTVLIDAGVMPAPWQFRRA